jgi:hypothetical protein
MAVGNDVGEPRRSAHDRLRWRPRHPVDLRDPAPAQAWLPTKLVVGATELSIAPAKSAQLVGCALDLYLLIQLAGGVTW